MPHTPQEQQELPASFWTGLEFSKLHICPAAPSQGLLRATSVPLLWINVIRSAHPMQGPSQGIQAGFSLPRTLHIKGLPCSQGSSLPWRLFFGISGHFSGISERSERQAVKCASRASNTYFSAPTTCHLCLLHFPTEMGTLDNNSYLQLLRRVSVRVGG